MRVCVFCGSAFGARPIFVEAARSLGAAIAARGLGLVYGGASVGLMGVVADAALADGGEVIGVIPQRLVDRELAHRGLSALHVVDSMHARKAKMASLSDAFVALPGGFGTLDELAEIVTWRQLGLHDKPFGLLDVDGYFEPLIAWTRRAVEDGFVKPEHRALLHVSSTADGLLATFFGERR
jgi:uncharacterized protein (TIGR00730 family)